jgi:hypothetical protein
MASKKSAPGGVVAAAARAGRDLDELGVRFALVGGLAVAARSEPRFTRDVDLAIATASDREAEHIVHAMAARGYRVQTVIEHRRFNRLATARLLPAPSPDVFVDLLFASSGIEAMISASAEVIEYDRNVRLPVARVGHLIALKVLAESDSRLQDRLDLTALARVATVEDWALAETSVRDIRAAGYHRGRALVTRLRRFRQRLAR